MLSTMMDRPLLVSMLFEHGRRIHSDSRIICVEKSGRRAASFGEVAERVSRLSAALRRLGVEPGDRVATVCWNTQQHAEAYFAVPNMGAVLHTGNIRFSPEQLLFTLNHAGDKVVLVDDCFVPLLAAIRDRLTTVEAIVVIGDGDASALGDVLRYEELLAAEEPAYDWPDLDERSAAYICYTTGTTGDPKGVAYSHRSTVLHSLVVNSGSSVNFGPNDKVLAIVPLFHANGWGLLQSAWVIGSDFILPGASLHPESLCKLIEEERPTVGAAVPAILSGMLAFAEAHGADLSSLSTVLCGGAAVPRALMERFEQRFGTRVIQAWGMTETSPAAAVALTPRDVDGEAAYAYRTRSGRILPCVETRIVDESGAELPWDGTAVGEIEVRGPWVTGSYIGVDAPDRFHDGWLRTGDIGSIDSKGYIQISDRAKDVIKSGGEWISSVELEGHLMSHPKVLEAAVVGIPDPKWDERPLACVVVRPGETATHEELAEFLAARVPKWWVPDRFETIAEVPKTSVGKFDKKALRARFGAARGAAGEA